MTLKILFTTNNSPMAYGRKQRDRFSENPTYKSTQLSEEQNISTIKLPKPKQTKTGEKQVRWGWDCPERLIGQVFYDFLNNIRIEAIITGGGAMVRM